MKNHIIAVIILIANGCNQSFGQVSHMTIKTPYGPQTIRTATPGYQPYRFTGGNNSNGVYIFHVILKNDSSFTTRSSILVDEKGHKLALKRRKFVSPSETKLIYRETMPGVRVEGVPTDSCWLFKTVSGKINVYSAFSEPGMGAAIAIQDGAEGAIVRLTEENVEALVAENLKALAYVRKKKLTKAIRVFNKG